MTARQFYLFLFFLQEDSPLPAPIRITLPVKETYKDKEKHVIYTKRLRATFSNE